MTQTKAIFFSILVLCTLATLGVATSKVTSYRSDLPPEFATAQAVNIDPVLLRLISGEFSGLVSDYMLLKAAVIIGGNVDEMTRDDWRVVYSLYKQSVALDPHSYQNAYYVQGNLVWIDEMTQKAIDLIKVTAEHRPWQWEPKWFIAFDYFEYLDDMANAEHYMTQAAQTPGAPAIIGLLAARLISRDGRRDTVTAIQMLKAMYEQTDLEENKRNLEKRIKAYLSVYRIEQAIAAYTQRFQHTPPSLEALIEAGVLDAMPPNPYNRPFSYNPDTGFVYFDEKHF